MTDDVRLTITNHSGQDATLRSITLTASDHDLAKVLAEYNKAREALEQISAQAVCRGMDGTEGDGVMLQNCYLIAERALGREVG